MSINKTYAVFGLGKYGTAVAAELTNAGAEVIAVDLRQDAVDAAGLFLPTCKCADVTDPEVIRQLGIGNVDTVIIAMADSLEASVMATILCKEAGVQTVITKCADEIHKKISEKVGADLVVFPESESGTRLAKNLLSSGFVDLLELTEGVSMVELEVRDAWVGKSLAELNLRKKYALNVVALHMGAAIVTAIDPMMPLNKDMKLIVIADTEKLTKLK